MWRDTRTQMRAALGSPSLALSTSAQGYALLATLQTAGAAYDLAADDGPLNVSPFAALLAQYEAQAEPPFLELDRLCRWVYSLYVSSPTFLPIYAVDYGVISLAQADKWSDYIAWQAELAAWTAGGGVGPAPTMPPGAAIPTLTPPAALPWQYSGANFGVLLLRHAVALALVLANVPASDAQGLVLLDGYDAWFGGLWWPPPVQLAGTTTVTNGSAAVSWTVAQTLPTPTQVTFSSQPDVTYTLTSGIAGTSGTLTTVYTGTPSSTATTTALEGTNFSVPPTNPTPGGEARSNAATAAVTIAVDNCNAWLTASTFS